jgi:hypothetical protein
MSRSRGAVVVGAVAEIVNAVSHYDEKTLTDAQGKFEISSRYRGPNENLYSFRRIKRQS